MSSSAFRLVVETGTLAGQEIPLTGAPVSLGREHGNDVVFTDPEVSRRHARLLPQEGGYVLVDLGSTNGTYVNEQRLVAPRKVDDGDMLRLGETLRLRLVRVQGAPPPPVVRGKESPGASSPTRELGGEPPLAAGYEPPSAYQPSPTFLPPPITPPANRGYRSRGRRWLIGCAVIAFVAVVVCSASLYWLDANRPDLLYEPLRALLELVGLGG